MTESQFLVHMELIFNNLRNRTTYYTVQYGCLSYTHPSGRYNSWHWLIFSLFRLVSLDRVLLSLSSLLRSLPQNTSSSSDVICDMLWIIVYRRQMCGENLGNVIFKFLLQKVQTANQCRPSLLSQINCGCFYPIIS